MGSIAPRGGLLYFDFRYRGVRCREYTKLGDSPGNRRKMETVLKRIESEISFGTFDYERSFPGSNLAARFAATAKETGAEIAAIVAQESTPQFSEFVETWKSEKKVEWRRSYIDNIDSLVNSHLNPFFGPTPVGSIDRQMVLAFRIKLAEKRLRADGTVKQLSAASINRVVGILSQIMNEASIRYDITNPCSKIKRLKLQKVDIEPFTINDVRKLIATIRPDYRNYLTMRFFTGMRSGEAHGLKWKHVDFGRRQILIRETFQSGRTEYTKTDGSQREIEMSQPVFDAITAHVPESIDPEGYVFHTRNGLPIDNKNFNNRVWQPLLRHLGLRQRRPYQMRHTCATLWLAAGENPEWIARQLGHTNTEMLFRVYSRYVPNLTRNDGSAFDRMVSAAMNGGIEQAVASKKPTAESPQTDDKIEVPVHV